MATIQDVARKAGVSISTVSYVLSGTRPISDSTKNRILQAMAETGYQPNALAQGLASRRSRIIALLMNPVERDIGSTEMDFVNGAAQAAHDRGYHLVLWADPVKSPADLEELGRRGLVEAVLLMEIKLRDWRVETLSRMGIPCAMIGRPADPTGLNWVDVDFERTMSEVLDVLIGDGHHDVLLCNQSQAAFDAGYGPAVRIQECFLGQCQSRGVAGRTVFCGNDAASGLEVIQQTLPQVPATTALLVLNDQALPGIIHGARELGKRIPDDLSLVALLSSERTARHFWPALSTMDIPGKALGQLGMNRLIEQLEAKGSPPLREPALLPCQWNARGTSGPARTA